MSSTISQKCPTCGSNLEYDADLEKWPCEYCHKNYSIDELVLEKAEDSKELEYYHCSNCGAEIFNNKYNITANCIYCDSPVIIKQRIAGEFNPNHIIPFKSSKKEILNAFKEHISLKRLLPKDFFSYCKNIQIEGMYVPYWILTAEVSAAIYGTTLKRINGQEIANHYRRKGTMSFDKIPADAKTTINSNHLDAIEPFDYKQFEPFNYAYLLGYYAEKYDTTKDEVYEEEIKKRIEDVAVDKLLKAGTNKRPDSLFSKNVNIYKSKFEYMLVPVWIIKVKYKGKTYDFYMNDQSKKLSGTFPVSVVKEFILSIIIFLTIFIPVLYFFITAYITTFSYIMIAVGILAAFILKNIVKSYSVGKTGKKDRDYITQGSFFVSDNSEETSYL